MVDIMTRKNSSNNRNPYPWKQCVMNPSFCIQLLVTLVGWCHVSTASLCTPNTSGTNMKPLPNITGSYTAYMEWWDTSTQTFFFRQEYVDQENNMAAIRIYGLYDPGDLYIFISDYNTQQLFTVSQTKKGKQCRATALESYEADTFPSVFVSNRSREHIASTHTLLNFGAEFHEVYKGNTNFVRGKMADRWTACIHNNDTHRTVKADYYFSLPDWFPSNSESQVPLRSVLTSDLPGPIPSQDLRQTTQIDYVYFSHDVTDTSIFQEASGMYCEGRKATRPVPNLPSQFQFQSEIILPVRQEITITNEVYDLPSKLVKVESTSPSIGPHVGGGVGTQPTRRTTILDFNSGISYILSLDTGRCDLTPITPDDFNTRVTKGDHIRIATAKEFARFDSGNFVYSGQTKVRGMECDTWSGQTSNFPDGLNATSHWTWYFKTAKWMSTSLTSQTQVPVFLDIKIPEKGLEFWHNIYDFQTSSPDWSDVDISDCFHHTETRMIQFSLIGNLAIALGQPKMFRQQMIQRIANVMNVSILRISNFQSHLDAVPTSVTFTLLGLPGVKGDVTSQSSEATTTLKQAVEHLNDTIGLGLVFLRFYVRNPQNREQVIPIYAAPSSIQQTIQYPNGTTVKSPSLSSMDNMCTTSTTATTTTTTTTIASSLSSTSSASLVPSKSSSKVVTTRYPRVTFLGGVTRASTPATTPDTNKLCNQDKKDSSTWDSKSVAGLCVGVAVLGLLVGVIGTGVVQGWARPCLRFKSNKNDQQDDKSNAYSLM